jgi:hypothetical protein
MREVILCNASTNEIFHDFVRLSTFTPEPLPFEYAMGQFKVGGGPRFFEFLQSFVLLVMQEKQPSGKLSDVFDDPRFFPLVEKFFRMSPYYLSLEECQSKRSIISSAIAVEAPPIPSVEAFLINQIDTKA